MRNLLVVTMLSTLLSGCTLRNNLGECEGLAGTKRPGVEYQVSKWNVAMAILFSETFLIPGLVAAFYLWCPVSGYVPPSK